MTIRSYDGRTGEWLVSEGTAPSFEPVLTPEEQLAAQKEAFRQAVQAHIDAIAGERGYAAGHTLAGYVASAVPLWQAEAQAFVAWRDDVWTAVFVTLAEIEAGEAAPPESAQALIDTLPAVEWPNAV